MGALIFKTSGWAHSSPYPVSPFINCYDPPSVVIHYLEQILCKDLGHFCLGNIITKPLANSLSCSIQENLAQYWRVSMGAVNSNASEIILPLVHWFGQYPRSFYVVISVSVSKQWYFPLEVICFFSHRTAHQYKPCEFREISASYARWVPV